MKKVKALSPEQIKNVVMMMKSGDSEMEDLGISLYMAALSNYSQFNSFKNGLIKSGELSKTGDQVKGGFPKHVLIKMKASAKEIVENNKQLKRKSKNNT